MRLSKLLPVAMVFASLACCVVARASNSVYLASTAANGANGGSCSSAYGVSFFNTSSNWGTGSSQIGPGTVVYLCAGIYTGSLNSNLLTFQGSGTSAAPITLTTSGAVTLTSPAWNGSNGAINTNGKAFLTINGNSNLTITNSANGDGLANHQVSVGINGYSCNSCTFENVAISNIYIAIKNYSAPLGGPASQMNALTYSGQNGTISGNVIHDCGWCVYANYANGDTNLRIYNNEIYDWGHAAMFATAEANTCSSPCLLFHDNNIHDNINWETAGCVYHDDGLHTFGTSGSSMSGIYFYNNWFHGSLSGGCSSGFLFMEEGTSTPSHASNVYIWNNVFDATGADSVNPNGWMGAFSAESGVLQIYNNFIQGPSAADTTVGYNIQAQGANVTFENNVSLDIQVAIELTKGPGSLMADYNMYGNACQNSDNCFVWSGSQFAGTFSGWKTTCACDSHSITTSSDSANKFSVGGTPQTGSPAIGAGTNLALTALGNLLSLASDTTNGGTRTSTLRPLLPLKWDMGAYESGSNTGPGAPNPPTGLITFLP